eukprot:evm.model.scf_191.3 EVM.evm.TU.scf_191.3   scf_191:22455-23378(+)
MLRFVLFSQEVARLLVDEVTSASGVGGKDAVLSIAIPSGMETNRSLNGDAVHNEQPSHLNSEHLPGVGTSSDESISLLAVKEQLESVEARGFHGPVGGLFVNSLSEGGQGGWINGTGSLEQEVPNLEHTSPADVHQTMANPSVEEPAPVGQGLITVEESDGTSLSSDSLNDSAMGAFVPRAIMLGPSGEVVEGAALATCPRGFNVTLLGPTPSVLSSHPTSVGSHAESTSPELDSVTNEAVAELRSHPTSVGTHTESSSQPDSSGSPPSMLDGLTATNSGGPGVNGGDDDDVPHAGEAGPVGRPSPR